MIRFPFSGPYLHVFRFLSPFAAASLACVVLKAPQPIPQHSKARPPIARRSLGTSKRCRPVGISENPTPPRLRPLGLAARRVTICPSNVVFIRIWNNLLWPSNKAEQEKLASVLDPNSPSVKDFFDREGGFPVGIASRIEEPSTGRIIWGTTNDHEAHKDELGWQILVLNAKLCAEYELTFQEEEEISSAESSVEPTHPSLELTAIRARRAQLGSLIAITFAHEGMHAYLRWKLGDSVDAAVFNTIPDYGMNLESRLFRGCVQIQIAEEDSKATDRFRRIQNIWLKVEVQKQKDPAPAFRLIREAHSQQYNLYT
ncbi:hypothetical protein DFH06DRAFT_1344997 [Mycena polygramma]|nr:hypothetical protein DFH06DRAFT_1344997 [Mycena polygramma]